jgi:hypothetical protein
MASFPVLAGIDCLTLLVDHDLPDKNGKQRGQQDSATCAARWRHAGREVLRLIADRPGDDLNDVIMRGAA